MDFEKELRKAVKNELVGKEPMALAILAYLATEKGDNGIINDVVKLYEDQIDFAIDLFLEKYQDSPEPSAVF